MFSSYKVCSILIVDGIHLILFSTSIIVCLTVSELNLRFGNRRIRIQEDNFVLQCNNHNVKNLMTYMYCIKCKRLPHMGIQYKLKISKLIYYLFQQEWLFKSINIFDQQIWISFPYRYVAKYFSFAIETLLYSEHFLHQFTKGRLYKKCALHISNLYI